MGDKSQLPKIPVKLEKPSLDNAKELEYLKTIEKLKRELEQKNQIVAEKEKQLENKDNEISLLTDENKKLKAIIQEKDCQLAKYKEKLKETQQRSQITNKNNQLIENYKGLKNIAKSKGKSKANNNQIQTEPPQEKNIKKILLNSEENLSNNLSEIKEKQNNLLATREKNQTELLAQIQV